MTDRAYLTHFRRGGESCPLCDGALVWRRTGERKFTPCDSVPVLCMWEPDSPLRVVYRGEIVCGVRILTKDNAADFVGKQTFRALQPHVFTCPALPRTKR